MARASPYEYVLEFGKHRGEMLKDVPFDYLCFLTQWDFQHGSKRDIIVDFIDEQTQSEGLDHVSQEQFPVVQSLYKCAKSGDVINACKLLYEHRLFLTGFVHVSNFIASRLYVRAWHPQAVEEARALITQRRLCFHCGSRIVPIGSARANGKSHNDWDDRLLHKKCWIEL